MQEIHRSLLSPRHISVDAVEKVDSRSVIGGVAASQYHNQFGLAVVNTTTSHSATIIYRANTATTSIAAK